MSAVVNKAEKALLNFVYDRLISHFTFGLMFDLNIFYFIYMKRDWAAQVLC